MDEVRDNGRPQLDDALERKVFFDMKETGAYVGSHGDPEVMDSFKEPASLFSLFLITGGLLIVGYIIGEISNYIEIQTNWSHYRCMPSVTPFARFYGFDLAETMNFCMSAAVREHAPAVIDPIYRGINVVNGVVDGVYNKVTSIAGGVAYLLKGFEDFVIGFMNSFRLLGVRVRLAFVRMKNIFDRIYGIFIAFSFAAISAITFGQNLICNPLGVFLGTITGVDVCCFAPDTPIVMADGSVRPIAAIRIGDTLAGGAVTTTTYLFDGSTTPMVRIGDVHVSTNHYLRGPTGAMVQAGAHPAAVAAPSLPRLWCLATSNNRIPIMMSGAAHEFADYEESSDPAVTAEAQRIAEAALNGGCYAPTVPDYSLGLDPTLQVFMSSGNWKPLSQVRIDDELMGGGRVIGVIQEDCEEQCITPGGHYVSAAQLVLYGGKWLRAAYIWPKAEHHSILTQLMVTNNLITVGGDGDVFHVRDYAEITDADMQTPYDQNLKVQ